LLYQRTANAPPALSVRTTTEKITTLSRIAQNLYSAAWLCSIPPLIINGKNKKTIKKIDGIAS
jgi:hypothetical protein